jgi:hypothetical protein
LFMVDSLKGPLPHGRGSDPSHDREGVISLRTSRVFSAFSTKQFIQRRPTKPPTKNEFILFPYFPPFFVYRVILQGSRNGITVPRRGR